MNLRHINTNKTAGRKKIEDLVASNSQKTSKRNRAQEHVKRLNVAVGTDIAFSQPDVVCWFKTTCRLTKTTPLDVPLRDRLNCCQRKEVDCVVHVPACTAGNNRVRLQKNSLKQVLKVFQT